MGNLVFNAAKGRINELQNRVKLGDPSTARMVVVLFDTTEADVTLATYTTLAEILAGANSETAFGGYTRKEIDPSDMALPAVSGTSLTSAIPAVTWVSAGAGSNLLRGVVCYVADYATDSADNTKYIPLTAHDVSESTNGNNLNLNAGVYYTAS